MVNQVNRDRLDYYKIAEGVAMIGFAGATLLSSSIEVEKYFSDNCGNNILGSDFKICGPGCTCEGTDAIISSFAFPLFSLAYGGIKLALVWGGYHLAHRQQPNID